jgi:hypothetical protein
MTPENISENFELTEQPRQRLVSEKRRSSARHGGAIAKITAV